jgi:hypothetical protein
MTLQPLPFEFPYIIVAVGWRDLQMEWTQCMWSFSVHQQYRGTIRYRMLLVAQGQQNTPPPTPEKWATGAQNNRRSVLRKQAVIFMRSNIGV